MVAPLIAAAARLALSKAAQTAAKKAATSNIAKKAANVAAQRYTRASTRYLNEAEKIGSRTRYGQLLVKAARRTEALAKEIKGVDYKSGEVPMRVIDAINDSEKYLVRSTKTSDARGDLLGETLLNGTMQGHRLFAMTRDLWSDVGYENRYQALRNAFGGDNLADIILQIEKDTKVNIMKGDINSKERYGTLSRAERMKVEQYIIEHYG